MWGILFWTVLLLVPAVFGGGGSLAASSRRVEAASAPRASAAGSAVPLGSIDELYLHRDRGRNLEASIEALEALLPSRGQDPEVLMRLGRSVVRLGEKREGKEARLEEFTRAQGYLEEAVRLDPKNPKAHYWLGVSMGRQGQLRGIFKSLSMVKIMKQEMKTVLELDPSHGGAHHVLGELYRELPRFVGGDKKKSLEHLELAFKLAPDYTASYVTLAEAYLDRGRKKEAELVLRKVLTVTEPEDPAEYRDNVKDARALLEKLAEDR